MRTPGREVPHLERQRMAETASSVGGKRWTTGLVVQGLPILRTEGRTAPLLSAVHKRQRHSEPRAWRTRRRLCSGRRLGRVLLTLLRRDARVLLALRPAVGHGLEAAGAHGVASLQGAHIILGCRANARPGRRVSGHRRKVRIRPAS